MKSAVESAKHPNRLTALAFAAILLAAMLVNGAVYLAYSQNFGAYAAAQAANDYEVRTRLLMDAMRGVGPATAEDAAQLWASGLYERSAALQYAAMSEPLKIAYEKGLEKTAPNWVTGVSSPWVESFEVAKITKPVANRYVYTIVFATQTSSGPAGNFKATLTIDREGGYWRITHIAAQDELLPYIGFLPQ